jgi:hypothetical protein
MGQVLEFPTHSAIGQLVEADGHVEIATLEAAVRAPKAVLAEALGLSRDAVSKARRMHSRATQTRLRDAAEIIARIAPWAGTMEQAFAWYRAQPLPSFGDVTAEALVKSGQAGAVRAYLDRIAEGGYA